MCGIVGMVMSESSISKHIIIDAFKQAERRGRDGFGVTLIRNQQILNTIKTAGIPDYSLVLDELINRQPFKIGDILLANLRAAPETEAEVSDVERTVQPIVNKRHQIVLVHNGAVSSFCQKALKLDELYQYQTDIDSETIVHAYVNGRNMKNVMEWISGGFAFLMYDGLKNCLYAVCSHNPLWVGHVRGYGTFWASTEESIWETISSLKGRPVVKNTEALWENYYCHQLPSFTINEIDIDSGMVTSQKYYPRYVTLNYDSYRNPPVKGKTAVLVAASGGLDSSTTLAVLKESRMNPIAIHFKYGHRGQFCEETAIKNITNKLGIPLKIFDIEENMKSLDIGGMLTDPRAKITTGTESGLKTTAAWTIFRNHLMLTYMGAYAESLMMNEDYEEIFLTGGFMQLTESGTYPDNSERFIDAAMKFFQFSITGTRIKPMYGLCNILKTEQYVLLNALGWKYPLEPHLISCDRPKFKHVGKNNALVPCNCSKNGKPACGSGLLSYWACKMSGLRDNRLYYEVDDDDYIAYEPDSTLKPKDIDVLSVIDRIEIPEVNKSILKTKVTILPQRTHRT